MAKEIAVTEAQRFVQTRQDLYAAMHRNGWFLPKLG
jgi:hypothetical protein